MKRTVKWILVLLAMLTVLALMAGTAGAEVERTLQLQIPLPPPRRGGAWVSGPDVDSPVTCTEYTFTVNNGTDTGVASYIYTVGLLEGNSSVADTLYKSDQTEDSTFSYTFYLPGTYALFVDRYDSNDNEVGSMIYCIIEIADNGNHAANPLYAKVDEIVSGLSGTSWDKALSLHDWLTHNAYYDGHFQYYGPDGVLLHGRGVCNSYARAYMLLCEAANIPVHRVTGVATNSSGRSESHAWNAIQLEGDWYLVDVTWDDPYTGGTAAVSGSERHHYFCLNDDLMGLNHDNNESLFANGQCNSLAMNYLVRMEDTLGMGDWILNPGQKPNLYTSRITAMLEQGETEFTVPCEDTLYVRIGGSSSYYRYAAGSPDAIRGWTLLAFWMSENGFELEGSDGADPVQIQLSVSYDRDANAFVCCEPEPPVPELNYTVRTDSGDLPENGTVEPGQWLTVTFGADPEIPDLEEYETSYSLFLCSGSPDGSHRQIGHLDANENGEYAFPAAGGAGNYYVQIWATVMVPSGDEYNTHSTIKEYFEFVIGEGSGEALPDAALFFPNVTDGSLEVGQEEILRAYMTGAEHIAVRTETEDGEAVATIGFDGFAGEETWRADAPGIYTLTLTGYTYDEDDLIAIPDRSVSCTVTVGTPSWAWSYEEGEQMISVTGSGTLAVNGTAPWLGQGYEIRRILIDEGITRIGTGVFAGLDGKVRIDFRQNVLPEFLGDAFGETCAVCRYLNRDASWDTAPASENVSWVWMPTFNFQGAGTFGSLWYEKDENCPGWSVTVNADGAPETFTDMPAATAHELVGYCHDVFLNAVPAGADLAALNGVESDLWYLYFGSDCDGSLTLNSANCSAMPLAISVFAPDLNLTVTCAETCAGEDSLRELTVTDGIVDYTGDTEKLLLKNTPSGHIASVTVRGTVGELAYYAEGSDSPSPYRGTLTVTGGLTGGLVYNGWDGTMAIHGVTDAYPLGGTPEQQFGPLTGLENIPVILYDDTEDTSFLNPEIDTEGGIVPTLDMFRLRYILGAPGENILMMTPLAEAGIGSEVIEILIDDYNENFLDDLKENIVWGSETELYVDGADITLPGSSDGKGLGELGAGHNSTVTVQCPVELLFFQPDPWQRNHITFYIEGPVASAYLQPNNCMLDLTLRDGGSIGSGTWKQLLRDYRNFGPCGTGAGETTQIVKESALLVMSWTGIQEHASILPSDAEVCAAAGTQAMADLTDTDLTQEELEALTEVSDGNDTFALDPSKIAWVFDVSVHAYTVDESGNATKGAAIGDLGGNAIPIQISNPTGNPDAWVIRLHEEDGVLTARKLDTDVTEDAAGFESDLFSTYLLAEPGEVIPPPVPELNYTVRTDSGELPENGTVEPGQWLTVTFGADPEIPDLEEYEISYSLFLCSGSPDGSHRQIGHLDTNENGVYAFPAAGGAGNYYVQIWATVMVPSGDEYNTHSTIKEYFEFVIGEGSGEALPDAALFFPNVTDGSLEVGQEEILRAYMTGAEHIAVRTETEDGEAVATIGFDGFAGEETWRADAPGIYTLTLTGYTYDDYGALIAIPGRSASCTVTVGTPLMEPTFVTPADLTAIGEQAFSGISARIVMITEEVESVGPLAFASSDVEQVIILNAETEIDDTAFTDCENLKAVFGIPGGKVQTWAEKNHIRFYLIPRD